MVADPTQPRRRPDLPLFDPDAGEVPPPAAVELYFEAPTTVGLLRSESEAIGRYRFVAAVDAAREAAMAAALDVLHDNALLKIGYHARQRTSPVTVGVYGPGQLYLTRVAHTMAADRKNVLHTDLDRVHDHIYLGEYGIADEDGQRWPVDLYSVKKAITTMHPLYRVALERSLSDSLGVVWSFPDSSGDPRELVEPALAQYVPDYPRVICRDQVRVESLLHRWNVRDIAHPPKFDPDAS